MMITEKRKLVTLDELKKIVSDAKEKNKAIIWTNGCFDILHVGHIRYLKEARKLGDLLIIGLNSDESVRALKGEGRPIQSQDERAEILSALEFVDYILIFPELRVGRYIQEIQPKIFVKGADYTLETMDQSERRIIESYGGKIIFLNFTAGKSTTKLISQIKKTEIKVSGQ